jgi:hypothetical protein
MRPLSRRSFLIGPRHFSSSGRRSAPSFSCATGLASNTSTRATNASATRSSSATAETRSRAAQANAPIDRLTIAAIAIVAYALANVLHEGLGHGGACLFVGCTPKVISSMHFDGDNTGLSRSAANFIEAGGTLANLLGAAVAFTWLRKHGPARVHTRYFAWLFGTINLLQATGYLLFSGVGNIGDWANIVRGLEPAWAWHTAMAVVGGATYWFSVRYALITMAPFTGGEAPERYRRGLTLMLVPYFTGAALYLVGGALNPIGLLLVAISAAPASLGGTSGLAWGPQYLRGDFIPRAHTPPTAIPRSTAWIVAAAGIAIVFVAALGPGITFGK